MYKKIPFKKPVAVETPINRLFFYLWEHWRKIVLILSLLLLSIALVEVGGWYQQRNREKAFQLFSQDPVNAEVVRKRYPRTDAAKIATLWLGQKALEQNDWETAISLYQSLKKEKSSLFRIAAMQNLALAYKGKGDLEQAINTLKQVVADPENPIADQTRLQIAELLRAKGEEEAALQIYGELESSTLPTLRELAEARGKKK